MRNELERPGTTCNKLEPPGKSWNYLESSGTKRTQQRTDTKKKQEIHRKKTVRAIPLPNRIQHWQ